MTLPRGLYDQLLTTSLKQRIAADGAHAVVDPLRGADSTIHLLDLAGRLLSDSLESLGSEDREAIVRQAEMIAHLLRTVREHTPGSASQALDMPEVPFIQRDA